MCPMVGNVPAQLAHVLMKAGHDALGYECWNAKKAAEEGNAAQKAKTAEEARKAAEEAKAAGAKHVGGDDLVTSLEKKIDVDVIVEQRYAAIQAHARRVHVLPGFALVSN